MKKLEIFGLTSLSEIKPGDRLAKIIVAAAQAEIGGIADKDIVVITEKIVSKALGYLVSLDGIKPGRKAMAIAGQTGEPAEIIQLILDNKNQKIAASIPVAPLAHKAAPDIISPEAFSIIDKSPTLLMTIDRQGRLYNEAGIDASNHPEGMVSFPPADPDQTARELRQEIKDLTGKEIALLLADTLPLLPFGSLDLPMGSSGIETVSRKFGKKDRFGKPKFGGVDITAFEVTAAASLLFGQSAEGIPAVIIRGLDYQVNEKDTVQNTLAFSPLVKELVKATLLATAKLGNLRNRLLYRLILSLWKD